MPNGRRLAFPLDPPRSRKLSAALRDIQRAFSRTSRPPFTEPTDHSSWSPSMRLEPAGAVWLPSFAPPPRPSCPTVMPAAPSKPGCPSSPEVRQAGPHRQGNGIARKCVAKWLERFATEGEAGLNEPYPGRTPCLAAPHPMSSNGSRPAPSERRVPDWIGACLGPPGVTGPGPPPDAASGDARPLTGEVIRSSTMTSVSYERNSPGELVHADVEMLGRIRDCAAGVPANEPTSSTTGSAAPAATTCTHSSMTTPGSHLGGTRPRS